MWAVDRGNTSASLQYYATNTTSPSSNKPLGRFSEKRAQARSQSPPARTAPDVLRPKSASTYKNPYPNVKAKVNSKPPVTPKLKSKMSPLHIRLVATPDSSITNNSRVESVDSEPPIGEEMRMTNDELLEKQVR